MQRPQHTTDMVTCGARRPIIMCQDERQHTRHAPVAGQPRASSCRAASCPWTHAVTGKCSRRGVLCLLRTAVLCCAAGQAGPCGAAGHARPVAAVRGSGRGRGVAPGGVPGVRPERVRGAGGGAGAAAAAALAAGSQCQRECRRLRGASTTCMQGAYGMQSELQQRALDMILLLLVDCNSGFGRAGEGESGMPLGWITWMSKKRLERA